MATEQKDQQPVKPRDVRAVLLVQGLLNDGAIELFLDITLQPRINIVDDAHQRDWSLYDNRAEEWLSRVFWAKEGEVLHGRECERVLKILRGLAREKTGRRSAHDQRMAEIVAKFPILEIVVEFMADRPSPYRKTAKDFYKDIKQFAKKHGFASRRGRQFPGGANILTRILNMDICTHSLAQLGIRYSSALRTPSGHRLVTLAKAPEDSPNEPSGEASALNLANPNAFYNPAGSELAKKAVRLQRLKNRRLQSLKSPTASGKSNEQAMEADEFSILGSEQMVADSRQPPSQETAAKHGSNVSVQPSKPVENAKASGDGKIANWENDGN